MMTALSVLVFIVIGAAIGFLGSRFFNGTSLLVNTLLGIVGSLGLSWGGKALGLGLGFMQFSLWGIIFAILGAVLLVAIYGLVQKRRSKRVTAA